jgi:NAD(P)-dependent dehydrogenase (short-subunit alcohol dehydrogenase family)
MELGLGGKVAVVTGASKGIGLAVTRRFVEEGARVIAGSRTISPELAELVDGGAVESVIVDLAEPNGPASLVAAAGDRLDILVNNVGSPRRGSTAFSQSPMTCGSTRSTWISWPACARSGPPSRACSPTAAG